VNRFFDTLQLNDYPRAQTVARVIGYVLFFLIVLLFAVPLTFPTRQLRSYLSREAKAAGYPLEIDELTLRGLGGVEVEGVRLTLPGKPGAPGENGVATPGVPEAELVIDKLTARVAILPMLFGGTVDVSFALEAGGGTVEDGRFTRKGEVIDLEIGKIAALSLSGMGIGRRVLASQQQLAGELDGKLGGAVKIHYGGTTDDLTGNVDLALGDAILRQPELALQGGLKLTDLAMGDVTLKVRMNLKANIATLAALRGSEKATVIHIEQMEAMGDQLELLTEETSHILIPPGKAGWKAATIQLHFAFALPDKVATGKKATGKDGEAAKADTDRLKWASILTMAGGKLKPFERNGFIGMTCTGPLARPQCRPSLPQVNVGTRSKGDARSEGKRDVAPAPGAAEPGATPPPAQPETPVDFRPAVRPEPMPEPPPVPQPDPVPAEAPRPIEPPMDLPPRPAPEGEPPVPPENGDRPARTPPGDNPESRPTPPPSGDNQYNEEQPPTPRERFEPDEVRPPGQPESPEPENEE